MLKYILQYDILLFSYRLPRAPVLLFRYVALCLLAVIVKLLLTKSCAESYLCCMCTIITFSWLQTTLEYISSEFLRKNILELPVIMAKVRDCIRHMKFEAEGWKFTKMFEINRAMYSNSERSEQALVPWDLETERKS